MKIWQFKVKSKVWLKNWEDEYKNLSVGDSFPQRATLSNKMNNCIGEIVLYYNSEEVKNKKLYKGVYLVCKIISNVYGEDDKWIDMEVLYDYREKPYMYNEDFSELHDYHNTTKIRKRAQTYEYIDTSRCDIKEFYEKILSHNKFLDEEKNTLLNEVSKIESSEELTETEKKVLIKLRIGQSKYREKVIDYWAGCSVTRYKDKNLLIASHIKPWKDSTNIEKLDVYNGLLLIPNLDKVFDRGYISFDDNGAILISTELNEIEKLGLNKEMKINIENEHKKYLKFHRDNIFK